jgi:hypothetical protein
MKEAGIQALSFTCPGGLTEDTDFLAWLKEALKSAHKGSRIAMVYGCSPRQIALAGLMGASHASVSGSA